ncbi:MAG: trans-2-enoyl-CoA reductase [Spirochaetes bacterium GWD1_61_31]|nr:MAG: trans-2-enoyl-CoA reductase [Spirochaetes bacterium GWB1_60_80]OHD33496.1 MAG: trans-2-enoyl-CoA reductase [Spirochaetes bacterium GWC1_61_12]OHD36905.1 MAG: trans-2-enoyl-CoA reductase [Spirochaetes bacterium GWD1_61_31]OHD42629.1 MAG: trans-2-enoyl-CoA reductase [Spirochaetes bacterium GWE1_60_18]OHD58011.1 MAG: trans-2-enoyl-CoA reductase [Spirochaetes bacterium GWF1_60_12]HAP42616.1 bifunctional NADH-specific enoyl-ACP reductase/trans-2-enoyl-CoA reductase [Spirochaetaceae bacteriu
MIMKAQIRGNMCLNAHPVGLAKLMETFKRRTMAAKGSMTGAAMAAGKVLPKTVLVLGCSTGYGLATRMTAAFSCGADTVGVSFENQPSFKRAATPGWYNNRAFDYMAKSEGLYTVTINADAFADATRQQIIELARRDNLKFDQVIYSLASPVRTDPTGTMHRSVIKPVGKPFVGKTIDLVTNQFKELSIEPANADEIEATKKVMGGEDWELWIKALAEADVLAPRCITLAYSYIGPEHSWPIYRDGTIGKAKEHLEGSVPRIDQLLKANGGKAYVSVNKALVTRASAVIPVIPLYISALFRIMKEMHLHEDCTDQALRLYRERLLAPGSILTDERGRIRLDDWEMREDVQKATATQMIYATEANIELITDINGFKIDFLQANGFEVPGVDYHARVQYE